MTTKNVLTVSFEIAWADSSVARAEYNKIYTALNAAIEKGLSKSDWWNENTSYYVVRTQETVQAFIGRVWNSSGMRFGKDRMLVLDANVKIGVALGHFADETVFTLLPFVMRIPRK